MKKNSLHNGFGIIEVLISAMILMVVVGSAVGLSRAMIRRNIISSQRVQGYNLLREGLEMGRVYRDTVWIDQQANEWNDNFPDFDTYFIFQINPDDTIDFSNQESEIIEKDDVKYTRKFEFKKIKNTDELNNLINDGLYDGSEYDLEDEIVVLNVAVSWDDKVVEASTILTNWKPQI
jgi:type II secretory pathway pseudopilin PulG